VIPLLPLPASGPPGLPFACPLIANWRVHSRRSGAVPSRSIGSRERI
jgi:hypothetical protein